MTSRCRIGGPWRPKVSDQAASLPRRGSSERRQVGKPPARHKTSMEARRGGAWQLALARPADSSAAKARCSQERGERTRSTHRVDAICSNDGNNLGSVPLLALLNGVGVDMGHILPGGSRRHDSCPDKSAKIHSPRYAQLLGKAGVPSPLLVPVFLASGLPCGNRAAMAAMGCSWRPVREAVAGLKQSPCIR